MTRPEIEMDAYLEGTLSAEQAKTLEAWINADPANAATFLHLVQTHQVLGVIGKENKLNQQAAQAQAEELDPVTLASLAKMEAQAQPLPADALNQPFSFETPRRNTEQSSQDASLFQALDDLRWATGKFATRLIRSPYGIGTAVAAVFVIGLLIFAPWKQQSPKGDPSIAEQQSEPTTTPPAQTAIVATLTAERNAVWANSAEGALAPGSPLRAGQRFTLNDGFAEITSARGAVAILQAPTTIELIGNDNAIHLHRGKLVGLCHTPASKGFVVKTVHADITDLGTEFGVEVRDSQVNTTVFTGEVELTPHAGEPQPLVANQTARLSVQGNNRELIIEEQLAGGFDQLIRPAIVRNASINLDGFEVRVVPRGVREDALLFTDRPHELNGMDASGIPSVLRGGDLVMMPTDASTFLNRSNQKLNLTLTIDRACDIYILYPEHIASQPWLIEDYTRTDMMVGIDRGVYAANESAGIGPGESIDNAMRVWKYKRPTEGNITVARKMSDAMYAVIVVPHETEP